MVINCACPGPNLLLLCVGFKIIRHSYLYSLASRMPSCTLKVKVTLEGQMITWSSTTFIRAIAYTFMHGFGTVILFDE